MPRDARGAPPTTARPGGGERRARARGGADGSQRLRFPRPDMARGPWEGARAASILQSTPCSQRTNSPSLPRLAHDPDELPGARSRLPDCPTADGEQRIAPQPCCQCLC